VTSLAAWLGSWLLTAFYFHLFSPVTLLANLFIVPASSAALACNVGSLFCGDWLPWVGGLFNNCAWFCMSAMVWFSHRAISLPGAFFHVSSPALADFVIYYPTLFAVLSGWPPAVRQRSWIILGSLGIGAFYLWRLYLAQTTLQITVLPLKGGSAVHCNAPGWANDLLMDCGNSNSVNSITRPFLWAQGVNRLPHSALTHGYVRDIGGAALLLASIPAGEVITGPTNALSEHFRSLIGNLYEHPEIWHTAGRGDRAAGWEVLHPASTDRFRSGDDSAQVLRLNYQGVRVLLLSELGRQGQRALADREPDLQADIVVAGLPELAEPLSDAMLELIHPRLIVIADSEFPATRRAGQVLCARLEGKNIPVLYTRKANAVTITINRSGWQARGMAGDSIIFTPVKN
jgi:competence protein ComEC